MSKLGVCGLADRRSTIQKTIAVLVANPLVFLKAELAVITTTSVLIVAKAWSVSKCLAVRK